MSDVRQLERFTHSAQMGWGARVFRNKRMLAPLIGGIGLAGWGISRRGWLGAVAAIGGGYLALESVNRIRPYHYGIHVSQTIKRHSTHPQGAQEVALEQGKGDAA